MQDLQQQHAPMRRQDRALTPAETKQVLDKGLYGVLSMVDEFQSGYGVPFSYVYLNDAVYLHSAVAGKKVDAVRHNDRVSFCVVGATEALRDTFSMNYESAIASGRVVEVTDQRERMAALIGLIDKYACDEAYKTKGREYATRAEGKTLVLKIVVEQLTGKARR